MRSTPTLASSIVFSVVVTSAAGCTSAVRPPAGPPPHFDMPAAIVTADDVATEAELEARGERALLEQRWRDAAETFRLLCRADPTGARAPDHLFNLGLSLEFLEDRAGARDAFLELATRFPEGPKARAALVRAATLDAYLEDWPALQAIGEALLARPDAEDIERIVGFGSRGLARVELGDSGAQASSDIHEGLDVSDRYHYGDRDVLPVAVSQLRFALGELRRARSEQIRFDPVPPDFVARLDERCGGLLEAQAAYAQAVRSVDPHWAAMAGYRVGEMYRSLHRDLMQIPPPATSKTERQRQVFYAFMHLRYRVLLEKGLREIDQTVALGERTQDSSRWIERAREAQSEMQTALADEKAQIERMPFTEAEVQAALDKMSAAAAVTKR